MRTIPRTMPFTGGFTTPFNSYLYGSSAFSPSSLFGASDTGGWYDFDDDMDTKLAWCVANPGYTNATFLAQFPNHALFQDSAGATAVTAVEQSIGMIKDKSGRGNHATQATTSLKPKWSARKNLLTYTEDFSNAIWTKVGLTSVTGGQLAPDGTSTATKIVADTGSARHAVYQNVLDPAILSTGYVYAKTAGVSGIEIGRGSSTYESGYVDLTTGVVTESSAGYTITAEPSTNGFWKISISGQKASDTGNFWLGCSQSNNPYFTGNSVDGIILWHPQIEYGSVATAYQSVVTATDYNAIGFPKYAKFDGVDDGLATGNVDFSAVDNVFVCAGVQKTSDAAQGIIVELTASLAANNGSFYLSAPNSAANNYAFASKGTISATDIETGFASPHTAVLSGISDISGDSALLRVNGVAGTAVTTDQGTGNLANLPIYIGRRGGASLPYTGVINQLVVVGKTASASEITNTERFIANKTGVTL